MTSICSYKVKLPLLAWFPISLIKEPDRGMGRFGIFIDFFYMRIFLKCRKLIMKLGIQSIRHPMARPSVSSLSSASLFLTWMIVIKTSFNRHITKVANVVIDTKIRDAVCLKYCSLKNYFIVSIVFIVSMPRVVAIIVSITRLKIR